MDNRLLFPAIITNIDDPLMIGRVRAEIESDRNDAILKSITDPPFNIKKDIWRSEEHTSELQSHHDLVCRLLLEKKN